MCALRDVQKIGGSSGLAALLALGTALTGCATGAATDGEERPDARRHVDAVRVDGGPGEVDAVRPPDARPADAAPCTPTWISLLTNGGFDSGPGGRWSQSSAAGFDLITNELPVIPQAGAYGAWLGGAPNGDDTLRQGVSVPASATRLRLSGYRFIGTEETSAGEYDVLDFELRGAGAATVIERLGRFSDNNAVGTWTVFQLEAAAAHPGTAIDLTLHSTQDATLNTNFFVDSLVLEAFACPP